MPKLGEIKKARELGYKGFPSLIWAACEICGKERWVALRAGQPVNHRCMSCAAHLRAKRLGSNHHSWKGGRFKNRQGYISVRIYPDNFFYPMADCNGHILEHRLVVAQALGRCLQPWEIVHHKKGCAKDDNRYPETLQLIQEMQHNQLTIIEGKVARLENKLRKQAQEIEILQKRVTLLEVDNVALRSEVNFRHKKHSE